MCRLEWARSWVEVSVLPSASFLVHIVSSGETRRQLSDNTRLNTDLSKRGGAGPRGVLATLSQYMLSSAATFSFFLAIGSVSSHFVTNSRVFIAV